MKPKKTQDVIQAVISDTHTSGNTALFIDREWTGRNTSHFPNSAQIEIRAQAVKYCAEVAAARKGKKLILVLNGDAIDGDHHHSGDVCTLNELEQADIHIELMTELQKRMNWQAGDELYYTKGTNTHTHEMENYIGRELNAVPSGEFYSWDFLPLETNGVLSWFVHHGTGAGAGANEGNSVRNYLRNIQIDNAKDGTRIPDILYTGHVHSPTYSTYIYREGMRFKTLHGIILPSWQQKTRYAWQAAPVARNKIGGVWQEIKADGTICNPVFSVMGYD